jgi:hypothetical protein
MRLIVRNGRRVSLRSATEDSEQPKDEMEEFLKISYLLSPQLVGLAVHGPCIKFDWPRFLARPSTHARPSAADRCSALIKMICY